jgi:tetratricopeptide (TPR) repeat protein
MKTIVAAILNLSLVATLLLLAPYSLAHEGEDEESTEPPLILGVLDFPNSGSDAAQEAFERGVKLLHSFEFDDAQAAFIEAQDIDERFVMAIWGEAMTLNHPLWADQDQETALQVLEKLEPRDRRKASKREERYLDAIFILYGEGAKPTRDMAYREEMRLLYEEYPDDLEAAAFYSLSILGSVYERDFRTYMLAASIAEEVFAKEPQHPGAAHYLIHSYDDQIHAPLGLRAARVYANIAPAASHAQHMVSHIYTSLGMWDEVVEANIVAVRVSEESKRRSGADPASRSKHSLHWLEYALLQQGRFEEAQDTLRMMKADVAALPDAYNRGANSMLRASYVVEDPFATPILAATDTTDLTVYDDASDCFATAFVAIANNDTKSAFAELNSLQRLIDDAVVLSVAEGLHESDNATSEDDYLLATIMAREIEAILLFRGGDTDQAIDIMTTAAADENARPLYYGPPHVPKPSSELLGEMYLQLGRPEEAIVEFEKALARNTGRSLSILGLARAEEQAGTGDEIKTWQILDSNWRGDASELRELQYSWLTASIR